MHRPDVANISERHEKYTEQNRSGFAASTISLQCPVCRGRAEVRDARENDDGHWRKRQDACVRLDHEH
jgi:hypothetical protein